MHWGSFLWGVAATLFCGGLVAVVIGVGGSEGWWN